jgi:ABC-type maltose transport system permease subunit
MAIDPRGVTRPTDLNLFPTNANLDAFEKLLTEPFLNVLPLHFSEMLINSLFLALGTSLVTVLLGSAAAYAFSRFKFIGRQAGMLAFIILLMLPATGVIIPLFILFTSIKINSALAAAPPAFFTGGLAAGVIFVVYSIVRGLGKFNPERMFNPSPKLIVAGVAILTLIMITGTFYVMLLQHPTYGAVIRDPLKALKTEFETIEDDYNQRVTSVSQRENTARIREARAELASQELEAITTLRDAIQNAADDDEIAVTLNEVIASRINEKNADEDIILQVALTSQEALDTGDHDAAFVALSDGVSAAEEEALTRQENATSARDNVIEAQQSLSEVEASVTQARNAYDAEKSRLGSSRSDAMQAVVPQIILAWVSALIGAGIIWGALVTFRERIDVDVAMKIMLWSLLIAITIWLGVIALDNRVGSRGNQTETLRTTLFGLSIAFASSALPFAIWNLKGYFDTIPKELEEAALIDGAGRVSTFFLVIVPLAMPAFAIVVLFSFMNGWTEFILSWVFLVGKTQDTTLAMALATLAQGSNKPPPDMQKFAAMSILISLPILVMFFSFQRWIVGGLSIGGVKG